LNTKKFIFNEAKLKDKEKIENIIRSEVERYSINKLHAILVFHELYNNAYLNNYCWPHVKIKFLKKSLIIRIDCKGQGFDYTKYLKPTKDKMKEYILNESGRGIMMVEKVSTRLIYNKKGNNVVAQLKEHKEEKNGKNEKS
jgi:hypothetical protein